MEDENISWRPPVVRRRSSVVIFKGSVMTSRHPVFPHLFQPFQLKNVTLRNRVAISGHFAGWYVGPGGLPSDELAAYIEERAKGGVGLFVIGSNVPVPRYDWLENTSDAIVPRYRVMAAAGQRHGMAVFAQLCHPGFFPLPAHHVFSLFLGHH
jgi:2,4-dienoyl-CoA reductase-like NADH-dependent reductase (Old Yellow Enzyme family)